VWDHRVSVPPLLHMNIQNCFRVQKEDARMLMFQRRHCLPRNEWRALSREKFRLFVVTQAERRQFTQLTWKNACALRFIVAWKWRLWYPNIICRSCRNVSLYLCHLLLFGELSWSAYNVDISDNFISNLSHGILITYFTFVWSCSVTYTLALNREWWLNSQQSLSWTLFVLWWCSHFRNLCYIFAILLCLLFIRLSWAGYTSFADIAEYYGKDLDNLIT